VTMAISLPPLTNWTMRHVIRASSRIRRASCTQPDRHYHPQHPPDDHETAVRAGRRKHEHHSARDTR
jgi:hypothetical protein